MTSLFSITRCRAARHGFAAAPALLSFVQQRGISVSATVFGKRNFRKFWLGNKRGTKLFRREQNRGKLDYAPVYTEVQDKGFKYDDVYHKVPEMIPEFIVPDLTDCQLKPYVSYRTADIYQSKFGAQDLFDVLYSNKIRKDFEENKLDADGNPLEPNERENFTPEEAWILARKTGSDLFSERIPKQWECLEKNLIEGEPEEQRTIQISSYDLTHPSETKPKPKFLTQLALDPSSTGSSKSK